jgi:hypothetical protein
VKALHIASDAPFSLEERLINVGEVPRAAEEPFTQVSAGAWLIAHIPWTEAEHRISATSAGAFESDKLQIAPQSACLVVERQTWRLDRAITYVRLVFPGKNDALSDGALHPAPELIPISSGQIFIAATSCKADSHAAMISSASASVMGVDNAIKPLFAAMIP